MKRDYESKSFDGGWVTANVRNICSFRHTALLVGERVIAMGDLIALRSVSDFCFAIWPPDFSLQLSLATAIGIEVTKSM